MKQLKRLLSLVLCCSMLVSQLPGAALAANTTAPSGSAAVETYSDGETELTWSLEGDTLTVSCNGAMPDWTEDYPPWYEQVWNNEVRTIVLEEGITHVGAFAFSDCHAVTRVIVKGPAPTWGEQALHYEDFGSFPEIFIFYPESQAETWTAELVDSLKEIYVADCIPIDDVTSGAISETVSWSLENGILTISGQGAVEKPLFLYHCDKVRSIVIEEGITTLADQTLHYLPYVQSVVFHTGASVSFEEGYPFYNDNIQFYYPADDASWADYASYSNFLPFKDGDGGTFGDSSEFIWSFDLDKRTVTISGTGDLPDLTDKSDAPWYNYAWLVEHVDIGDGITRVGDNSFTMGSAAPMALYNYPDPYCALQTVSLPEGLTAIGYGAFSGSALQSVVLPESLTYIDYGAFSQCTDLESVVFAIRNTDNHDDADPITISSSAFENCTSLKAVDLPAATFGGYVFSGCTALESATTNGWATTSLGYGLFADCTALSSVHITRPVQTIDYAAFAGCTALETITIPPNVTTIEDSAFEDSGLKTVVYGGTPENWKSITIGEYNDPLVNAAKLLCRNEEEHWYLTWDYVLMVTEGEFDGTTQGVDRYDDKRDWVTAIELGADVTDITGGAIHNYTNEDFEGVTIDQDNPNFLVGEGYILSADGTRLIYCQPYADAIPLPDTVTDIDPYAFSHCPANTTVDFPGNAPNLSANALADLPEGLTFSFDSAMEGWSYPTWNGVSVTSTAVLDTVKLSAQTITSDAVTLTAGTKLEVPGTLTLWYSTDGSQWSQLTSKANVSTLSHTFTPSDLSLSADVETVWFTATVGEDTPGQNQTHVIQAGASIQVPKPLENLEAVSVQANLVTLSWDVSLEENLDLFSHFRLERTTQEERSLSSDPSLVTFDIYPDGDGNLVCGYNDTSVLAGTRYTYRVCSVFTNGYAGEWAEITVDTDLDTTPPVLSGLTPASSRRNADFTVSASATDTNALDCIVLSYSVDGGENWTELSSQYVSGKSASVSATMDVDALESDGELRIRAIAYDLAGNESGEYTVGYVIDRTAPAAPANLALNASTTTVLSIVWDVPADTDLASFKVYRSTDQTSWSYIASVSSNGYTDAGLSANTTYYYKVTALDTTGNESEASAVLIAQTDTDTLAPTNVSVSPAGGSTFGPNQTIRASAADDTALASLTLYYRPANDLDNVQWQVLKTLTTSAAQADLKATLSGLESGTYQLYASAADAAGNVSEDSAIVTYTLDCTAPVISGLTAQAGEEQVVLNWSSDNEADLSGFYIYRGATLAGSLSDKDSTSYTFTDTLPWNLCGSAYTYRVVAVDLYGNQSELTSSAVTPTASADNTAPTAVATMVTSAFAGDTLRFSAVGSWDDRGITSYTWDLGDGTTADTATVDHAYAQGGEYTVTLTVTDGAGNSDAYTETVTVVDQTDFTQLTITVLGYDSGTPEVTQPLKNAQVVYDLGGDNLSYYTNASGVSQFRSTEEGLVTIGAYMDGYLPASQQVQLYLGQPVELTLKLEKKPIVTGTLETRELTLQEITSLEIDTTLPENQSIYQYSASIDIGGNITEYNFYYNEKAEYVAGDQPVTTTTVGDSTYTISANVVKATKPANTGSGSGNVPEEVTIPYVTVLEIPGGVTVLKEFFEAELTILNEADAQFAFVDCQATLDIPDGLSVVPTEESAHSATTVFGAIYGQQSVSAKWILRGDQAGEYDLSASFQAILKDFDAPISAQFQAQEPIVVRDPSDVHLDMYISNTMLEGTFFVDLELYCPTDTLALPDIHLGDYTPSAMTLRFDDPNEPPVELDRLPAEIQPGQTLIYHYVIHLDESVNLLFQSNILKGQLSSPDMTVNAYTRNITKFALVDETFDFELTELGAFIRTLPVMSESDATSFWQFIYNTDDQPDPNDLYYRILTGQLDDYPETLEQLRQQILGMFELFRARLNEYVDDGAYAVGFLSDEIAASLWASLDLEADETDADAVSKSIVQDMLDEMKDFYCDAFNNADFPDVGLENLPTIDDVLGNIQGVTTAVSNLSGAADAVSGIIQGVEYGTKALGLVFNSEYAGRYAYFNYYLNNRLDYTAPDDAIFRIMLDSAKLALIDKYWAGGALNMTSWITGADSWTNHTDTIERWAETLYQFEVVALYYDNAGAESSTGIVTIPYRSDHGPDAPTTHIQSFPYDSDWFAQASSIYNPDLASLTLGMAMAAFSTPETDDRYDQTIPIGSEDGDRADNIRQAYAALGFDQAQFYNYDIPLNNADDKVAFSIAHTQVKNALGATVPLVAVFLRGGQYGGEWSSNFHLGASGDHKGFDTAAQQVVTELEAYLETLDTSGGVKVWMSGFSRAAATSNIAAHRMLQAGLVEQEDLFVYTFATPSGMYITDDSQSGGQVETNIFNIVSPHDVVPKVALSSWGFSKYGRTLVLPTVNTAIRNGYTWIAGTDLELTAETRYVAELIDSFLSAAVLDRAHYQFFVENSLRDLLADAHQDNNILFDLLGTLLGVAGSASTLDTIVLRDRIRAEQLSAALTEVKDNGFQVLNAHDPEYYLAWMKLGNLDSPEDFEAQYISRSICVECPVDIAVYDANDNLVAQITDNQVVVDKLPAAVVGDAKVVYLYDQDYRIVLTGTAEGTMTYTIREYSGTDVIREVCYYDVPLSENIKYTQTLTAGDSGCLTTITLADQSTISADADSQSAAQPVKHRIGAVNAQASLTAAAPGTSVTVTAAETLDGEDFAYWLVQCEDSSFALADITAPTAQFTMPDGAVRLEAIYGTSIQVSGGALQISGDTATLTADADSNGMTFLRWEVLSPADGLETLDLTQSTLSFPLPDSAVSLQAIFTPADPSAAGAPERDDSYAIIHAPTADADSVQATVSYMRKDSAAPVAICAFYGAEGQLVSYHLQELTFGVQSVTFQAEGSFTSAKIFVLDSTLTLIPLCPAKPVL